MSVGAHDSGLERIAAELVAAGEALPDPPSLPVARTTRREVVPPASPDPCNAIVRHVRVVGDGRGPLAGLRVSLKDCVACAGIPMSCGSAALEGFTPTGDATVTRRLLDAGAEIVAITNMDDLAFSGAGDSGYHGAVVNPHDRSRLAGGSSGGAAASLHYEGIDVAIGTDQGGSVRVPAAWCGVLGLKPTRGLVPYTGVAAMEASLDHVGVLATDATLLERVLLVLAGPDGLDPRQDDAAHGAFRVGVEEPFTLAGRRAVVPSGLLDGCDEPIRAAFERDLETLRTLGLQVERTSWDPASLGAISTGLFVEGLAAALAGHPSGGGRDERPWLELTRALQCGVRERRRQLSPSIEVTLRAVERLAGSRPGDVRSRAVVAARTLRDQLDAVLDGADFVLNPTTPCLPFGPIEDPAEQVARGWRVLANTGFANVTGHPSISLPGTPVDGVPTGLMLTARHGADIQLVGAARELSTVFRSGSPARSGGGTDTREVKHAAS